MQLTEQKLFSPFFIFSVVLRLPWLERTITYFLDEEKGNKKRRKKPKETTTIYLNPVRKMSYIGVFYIKVWVYYNIFSQVSIPWRQKL